MDGEGGIVSKKGISVRCLRVHSYVMFIRHDGKFGKFKPASESSEDLLN